MKKNTEKNWQSKKGWETNLIVSNARSKLAMMWFFSAVLIAIAAPPLMEMESEIQKGNWLILVVFIFPLVGIFMGYKATVMTMELRRFGRVVFEMDPYPGAIGGNVGGRIIVRNIPIEALRSGKGDISIKLECVHSYVSGSGKNRSRNENIRWAEEGVPHVELRADGVGLVFKFDVPEGLPEAMSERLKNYDLWRLKVKADIEGVDLEREYDIPVMGTGKKSRFIQHNMSVQYAEEKKRVSDQAKLQISSGEMDVEGLSRAMRFQDFGSELKLVFPMFRNKIISLVAGLFTVGFGFATFRMSQMALDGGIFGFFIGALSLPFALVALVAGLIVIYVPFNRLIVRMNTSEIITLRSWWFIPIGRSHMLTNQIKSISSKRTGSTGQGVDKVEHFKLIVTGNDNKQITIAEDIDGEAVCEHFKNYLITRLGIKL